MLGDPGIVILWSQPAILHSIMGLPAIAVISNLQIGKEAEDG